MRVGLIAKKLGMGSVFDEFGNKKAVTFLQVEDCQVIGHKNKEKDGYDAVVVGAFLEKASRVSKPLKGFFAKNGVEPRKILKEFRVDNDKDLSIEVKSYLKPSHFREGQYVDISGCSTGKGFAGVMKRHNFGGLEETHGVSISHRSHGSTGQCQDPGKVFKGKKMAGHLGHKNVTMQNLKIANLDDEKGLIIVAGSVPGTDGNFVFIRDAVKK